MSFFVTLNGIRCASARVRFPRSGTWFATVELPKTTEPVTSAELIIGDVTLSGTYVPEHSGSFATKSTVMIIGGSNHWGDTVPAKGFHNDGGVRRSQVAQDLAKQIGERLVVGSDLDGSLGVDYVRENAPASRVLETLFPSSDWWVGTDGVTRVGTRSVVDVSRNVQILNYDPDERCAELATYGTGPGSISNFMPGCSISDSVRMSEVPFVISESTVVIEANKLRAFGWSFESKRERVATLVRTLAREDDARRIFARGPFRYRVYRMAGDMVELQIVNRSLLNSNLPDILPVGIAPGMAGMKADLTPGAIVLVEFIEGDPALPIITNFSRPDDPGFVPVRVSMDAELEVKVGGGYARAIREGDKLTIVGLVAPSGGGPVTMAPGGASITFDLSVVNLGPPPVGKSKVLL